MLACWLFPKTKKIKEVKQTQQKKLWVSTQPSTKAMAVADQKQSQCPTVSSPKVHPLSLFIWLCHLFDCLFMTDFLLFFSTLRSEGGKQRPWESCCWKKFRALTKWLISKWESLSSVLFFWTKSKCETFILFSVEKSVLCSSLFDAVWNFHLLFFLKLLKNEHS